MLDLAFLDANSFPSTPLAKKMFAPRNRILLMLTVLIVHVASQTIYMLIAEWFDDHNALGKLYIPKVGYWKRRLNTAFARFLFSPCTPVHVSSECHNIVPGSGVDEL